MAEHEQLPTAVCECCEHPVYTYAITDGWCPRCTAEDAEEDPGHRRIK